jgi:hypothetical protein
MNKYFLSFIILALMYGCSDSSENKITTTQVVVKSVVNETFDVEDESTWRKADWANGNPFYNAWCKEQVSIDEGTLTLNLVKKECHSKTHASGEYRTQNTYLHGKYSVRFKASNVE